MRRPNLLWLLPALAAGGAATVLAAPGVLSEVHVTSQDLATLEAEYDAAFKAWKSGFDEAQGRERSELRKQHPARTFFSRFEEVAKEGEGLAFLWMLDHVKDLGLKREMQGPIRKEVYDLLLAGCAKEPWFDKVVSRSVQDARYLDPEHLRAWLEAAGRQAGGVMARELARLSHAELLAESDSPEDKKLGEQMLAEYERENIAVGATALDFTASTIDGHEFSLSDYRGKAVLLDFYGFW